MALSESDGIDDLLDLDVEECAELLAEEPDLRDRLRAEVGRQSSANPMLGDGVLDLIECGNEAHDALDLVADAVDFARRCLPLEPTVAHLRAEGRDDKADLLEGGVAAAGRWIADGGWNVMDESGAVIAFLFGPLEPERRLWVHLPDAGALLS